MEFRGGATLESLIREANEEVLTIFIFGICDLYYNEEKLIKRHSKRDLEKQIDFFKEKKTGPWLLFMLLIGLIRRINSCEVVE